MRLKEGTRQTIIHVQHLLDERSIGEEKGRKEGRIEATNRNARNIIIEFKANNTAPSFIFQFVKNAFKDDLTDEEIQQMIDDVEENE